MTIDYTKMKKGKPERLEGRKNEYSAAPAVWWKAEAGLERANMVTAAAKQLVEQQSERSQMNLMHARLYGNNDLQAFGGRAYSLSMANQMKTRVQINVIASCIDTLGAKIAKSRPRPSCQTNGGSWNMQQRAKKLNDFMEGVFYETKFFVHAVLQFLFACVFGTGALKVFLNDEGRLEIENVFIDELYVDDVDAKYGKPKQLFHRRMIDRDELLALAAGWKCGEEVLEAIKMATPPEDSATEKGFADKLEVWEAWKLKSGSKSKDGLHTIAIVGAELLCEEWEHTFFPFSFLKFKPRILGFWGQGLAETLTGIQVSINRTAQSIEEQLRRKGRGRIFVQQGSKVLPQHLTNGIADIVSFLGHPPIVDNGNAVASEDYQYLKDQIAQAFQISGVSQLSAAMQKPSGLDAQVALREFTDIESERFAPLSQGWDSNALNVTEICIALVAASGGKGYKVRLPNKRFIVDIDWKDIDMKRDDFILQMFPVSSLPSHPGARYQKVKEMYSDGVIDLATFKKLMDFPDIKAEAQLGNAAMDDAACVIGYILDEATPRYEPPDQYQNLELLISLGTASLLYAKHHGAEEERLDMLRRLIDESAELKNQATAAAAAPPPGANVPMGADAASPTGSPPMSQSQTMINPVQPAVPPLIS